MKKTLGFTFVELLITMAIFSILTGLVTLNLLNIKHTSSLSSSIDAFLSDVKQQQLKAMVGDTEGRGIIGPYGIYTGTTQYVLFHGASYNPTDSSNFSVTLGDNIQFSNTPATVVFTSGNGETGQTVTLTIKNILSNQEKTIQLNSLGVITGLN